MRDKLKNPDYWTFYLSDRADFLHEIAEDLKGAGNTYDEQVADRSFMETFGFNLASAAYSSGLEISKCCSYARSLLVEYYPIYVRACGLAPRRAFDEESGGWDFRTRYLALAVLCKLTPEEAKPLIDALDFWPERDALWEVFIAHLGRGDGRDPVDTLVWPEAYEDALAACAPEATDFDRQVALMQFDKGWLKEMRSSTNPFYSNHNNTNNTYVGYWNFEAAAIVAMFGIDDTPLANSKTYPKDWADWVRR
ncbi:PoNe immunity protein domain-containing protein [Tritonibacter litoralis]|nr:PoNe immunity protein domain-containing protein [Tritonibacter litoralis]